MGAGATVSNTGVLSKQRIEYTVLTVRPHGPDAEQAIRDKWEPVGGVFGEPLEERVRIQESFELTPAGKQKALERLEEKAGKVAERLVAKVVKGLMAS